MTQYQDRRMGTMAGMPGSWRTVSHEYRHTFTSLLISALSGIVAVALVDLLSRS